MKIALVNLCKIEDFAIHKTYTDSIDFLKENNIEYVDYASGASTLEKMVDNFHQALDSDAEVLWCIRGGNKCIQALDLLDWNKVKNSGKKFWGLSDFTHFASKAVSLGLTCYYGQGLTNIKDYFPTEDKRRFVVDFIKTGNPICDKAISLNFINSNLDISTVSVTGGHLFIFTFMQNQLRVDLKNRYLFIEYHTGMLGERLDDFGYYIDQLLYILKDNMPIGFIFGKTELIDASGVAIDIEDINKYCVEKLNKYNKPIFYIDHFKNTITFK